MSQQPHDPRTANGDFELVSLTAALHAWHAQQESVVNTSASSLVHERLQAEVQALTSLLQGAEDRQRVAELEGWLVENIRRLEPVLQKRSGGLVARSWASAHADSRLIDDGRVLLANAIDRDPQGLDGPLDSASDLASLLVGLEIRDEHRLAFKALDDYLRLAGQYELPRLLPVYQAIEALGRARRALARFAEAGDDEQPALLAETMSSFRRYLGLAEQYSEFRFPPLVIGVGVSGSGKSRFTRGLVERLGAIRLCSDVERRRLFGIYPQGNEQDVAVDMFSREATEDTYQSLARSAGALLDAGLPVCIDGTCLQREHRELLRHQAEARGLPVLLVHFEADETTLRQRIVRRAARQAVPAEESLAILESQCRRFEDFSEEERRLLVRLDTTADNAAETLAGLMQEHMR
ncbi:AAA family ATPase [Halomonas sp. 18H]|uniref:AAA family ATPase n=1 Tax=Halomonas almeriensis TaxID=308163 RepID=UPI0022325ECE|nr:MULTISPECIES: bifunctional aminoglycoside phosphotransferase/ATP-binding protein [Halomonas]MCW4152068.1 AAA family ATPase [Halomonas sp. 18H]MDN3552505.1 AAA family ATPase [Halomonas almeriensis]